jgi:mannose-6-phosphate isomerase-like protein (cupin superfamily)
MADRTRVDIEAVRQDWQRRGFSCDLWIDPPGQVWRNFVHAVDELVLPIAGTIELEVGGKLVRPHIGEEVFIPAGTRHTVRNVGNEEARWLYGYRREH